MEAMMDAVTQVPVPRNEPVRSYAPGSTERAALERRLKELAAEPTELTMTIAGEQRLGGGEPVEVVQPHRRDAVLGRLGNATAADARAAITAAKAAAPAWRRLPFEERAAILLTAADLLAGPWRQTLNAATMLGQSKTAHQAEIDSACELIDFWRFNVSYMTRIYGEQPISSPGVWNRLEYRPLEGFVFAVTPFNFTAIAGNLPASAALMGNTVVWKPASTAAVSAHFLMKLWEEAGLPPGVINLVYGSGAAVGDPALASEHLAGIHFTGSTPVFQGMWKTVGDNIAGYRNYPRIVGETGGKDFIVAHPTADAEAVATAILRGSFEYQGQKCSAASRVFAPASLWPQVRDQVVDEIGEMKMGDVSDFSNFVGAVIDAGSFATQKEAIEEAKASGGTAKVIAGGTYDDSEGSFVQPTVIETSDPDFRTMKEELFGPVVTAFVYDDARYEDTLDLIDTGTSYGLTGAVFARDLNALEATRDRLRYAAGNFYVNDKPTGAVVGQQPFGGARASGTNDKAGSMW